jgi:replicative DNA helicase
MKEKVRIFYSYSHKDEDHKTSLETHLSILKRQGLMLDWHDRKIIPGETWEFEIDKFMNDADIIILLISPDFIASDYCYGKELEQAFERYKLGKSYVVPIIIRPVDWMIEPLGKIKALPKDGKPVTTWSNHDEAWLDITKGIRIVIEKVVKNRAGSTQQTDPVILSKLVKNEFLRLESLYEGKHSIGGTPSGFYPLDELIDGIHNTDIVLMAGRPTMGKSDLALCIASWFTIEEGIPVAFFSMRLTQEIIARRLISSYSKIPISRIVRGDLREKDWPKFTHAAKVLNEAPIFIYEKSGILEEELSQQITKLKDECGLGLVIIDGIEQISSSHKYSDRKSEVYEIVKSIKTISRDYQVPIILTLNTSRESDMRVNKRPIIRDLEEWDILASDAANVVIMLYKDSVYNTSKDNPDKGITEIIIVKNDYGPCKAVKLAYLGECCSFANLAHYEENINRQDYPAFKPE